MSALAIASTAAVLAGFLPLPYGGYMLIRIVLCLTAVVGLVKALERSLAFWIWAYGVIAVLYNPVLPVRLGRGSKGLWIILGLVSLGFIWVGALKIQQRKG